MVLTLLATVPVALTQSREEFRLADSVSGMSTGRLTSKQLRIWGEVGKIAEAADEAGQSLHPRLHSLWQWAKGNGHTIVIDMTEVRGSHAAGRTTLEEQDRAGQQPVAVLWLNVYAIDNANPNLASRLSDDLQPSRKLGKNERYAEIVGHELTHAFLMLENPEYARLSSELRMEADRYLLSRRQTGKGPSGETASTQQQLRLQLIISAIEKPAEAAELEIWRELVHGHIKEADAGARMDPGWLTMLLNVSRPN
jgi:hypothetical protein